MGTSRLYTSRSSVPGGSCCTAVLQLPSQRDSYAEPYPQPCCYRAASSTQMSPETQDLVRATSQLPHAKLKHPSEQITQGPNKEVRVSGGQARLGYTMMPLNQM